MDTILEAIWFNTEDKVDVIRGLACTNVANNEAVRRLCVAYSIKNTIDETEAVDEDGYIATTRHKILYGNNEWEETERCVSVSENRTFKFGYASADSWVDYSGEYHTITCDGTSVSLYRNNDQHWNVFVESVFEENEFTCGHLTELRELLLVYEPEIMRCINWIITGR